MGQARKRRHLGRARPSRRLSSPRDDSWTIHPDSGCFFVSKTVPMMVPKTLRMVLPSGAAVVPGWLP